MNYINNPNNMCCVVAYYPTEAAARAAYNDLIADLAVKETVVSVREG